MSLDPGNVSTAMWEYLTNNVFSPSNTVAVEKKLQPRQPDMTPEESVRNMLSLVVTLVPQDTGKFILYDGQELPW